MAGESLRKEKIPRSSIHICDRGVSNCMKRVQAREPGPELPGPEDDLNAALGDPICGLIAEERGIMRNQFERLLLVEPESPKLRVQGIREKDIANSTALGHLAPQPNPRSWRSIREEDVPDVEPHDLCKPKTSSQGEGEDQLVSRVDG